MGKKTLHTPSSRITSALRVLWLRSRERAAAIKREEGCCQDCGAKGRAKATRNGPKVTLEVHHRYQPDWGAIHAVIREELLQNPDHLRVLCKSCHRDEHWDAPVESGKAPSLRSKARKGSEHGNGTKEAKEKA